MISTIHRNKKVNGGIHLSLKKKENVGFISMYTTEKWLEIGRNYSLLIFKTQHKKTIREKNPKQRKKLVRLWVPKCLIIDASRLNPSNYRVEASGSFMLLLPGRKIFKNAIYWFSVESGPFLSVVLLSIFPEFGWRRGRMD